MRTNHELDYCTHLRLPDGRIAWPDFECTLDVLVVDEWGERLVKIQGVYVDTWRDTAGLVDWDKSGRFDILTSTDTFWRSLAERARKAAEDDEGLRKEIEAEHDAAARENADCDRYHARRDEEMAR